MRVFDCNECGETLRASDDEELTKRLLRHYKREHDDEELEEDEAEDLIHEEAYDAEDS